MGMLLESTLLEAVTLLVGICTFIYYFFKSKYNYWKEKGVPELQPKFPFGNFKDSTLLRKTIIEGLKDLYDESAGLPYVGIYQFWKPLLLVRDPEVIKHILLKDFAHFHDRGITFGDEKVEPLGQHLFALEGAKWRSLRVKLSPTFTSGKMKFMFNVMLECAQELRHVLDKPASNHKAMEVKEMTAKFTTDVIGSCVFGLQFNSMKDPNSEFREMGRRIFTSSLWTSIKRSIRNVFPSFALLIRLKTLDRDIEKFFINAISDTMSYREQNNVARNDFLQLLMQLKNKGKVHDDEMEMEHNGSEAVDKQMHLNGEHVQFTDSLLAAQAFIFFLAGFETSSTTISFCLYELAKNPDVQTKLRKEIDAALEQHGSFSYECIQEITYLGKVVDETLRKYPPVGVLFRKVTQPYVIPNTSIHLEKGMRVFLPVYGLHHDPRYYPNPERFDPERFSEENKAKRPNYVYLPFGDGPRNCIGLRFGLLQTKVGLAVLLSKYKFSACEKTKTKLQLDPKQFITSPIGGIWLKISKRDDI